MKISRILFIPAILCAYLFGLVAFVPQVSAAGFSHPGGNVADPVVRQVDIDRPAIVRIITTIGGRLTVHFEPTSNVETFPLDGGTYPIQLSGTGAFISSHGDLLTADHVVNPPHDQNLDNVLYELAADDIANYVNSHFQTTTPFSANDIIDSLESDSFPSTTSYGTPNSQVYLSTSYAGPINADKFEDIPPQDQATVDQIEAQSSFDADDVAIVHVSGMDDMPSVQLADSSQVAELDNLTIIGYPGNGDVSETPTNLLTSSSNRIYISAIKTTDSGAPVIQVGGNVEHGDSGAPALDDNGNVVGIVSFGLSTPDDPGETAFLQASNSAESLIQSLNIDTKPGPFEKAWTQAMDDYSSLAPGHWHKAAQELQSLVNHYTSFLGATDLLTYAQSQASHEKLPTTSTGPSPMLIIGLILLVLVLIGLLLFALFKRRRSVAPANTGPVYATPGAYPFAQYSAPGAYPPSPASYGYQVPSQATPGSYPPVPASYASTAWYEQSTGQFSRTPVPTSVSQTPVPASSVQNPPSAEQPVAEVSLPTWVPAPTEQKLAISAVPVQVPEPATPANNVEEPVHRSVSLVNSAEISLPAWVPPAPAEPQHDVVAAPVMPSSESVTPAQPAETPLAELPTVMFAEKSLAPQPSPVQEQVVQPATFAEHPLAPQTVSASLPVAGNDDRTLVAPSSAPTWNFSVPRRPSSVPLTGGVETAGSSAQLTWIAPCGHANEPDARTCRVCSQALQANEAL